MNIEFNTGNDFRQQPPALNGWFSGFCPSNGIADRLNKQTHSALVEKKRWDSAYARLANGEEASEWADAKREILHTEKIIEEEKLKLKQEQEISIGLGLGAWCNGAVSKRKKAEASLRAAENALGTIKGSYETLKRQQTDGIKRSSEVILANNKTIESIRKQTEVVKVKIAKYKAERDAEKVAQAKADTEAASVAAGAVKKINTAGFVSKENLPLIAGGVLLVGVAVYLNNRKKKGKRKSNIKKVAA